MRTKKLSSVSDGIEARKPAHYLRNYEEYFAHLVEKPVKLLELGVCKGGSLLMWSDYFEKGRIVGLDFRPVEIPGASERIRVYQGYQHERHILDALAQENAPDGFDIIIDDCSHVANISRISFWHLFEHHLKPGGIYVIEDWGTGYMDGWIDGARFQPKPGYDEILKHSWIERWTSNLSQAPWLNRFTPLKNAIQWMHHESCRRRYRSHDAGMVGFIKELTDELGAEDITGPEHGVLPHRVSRFSKIYLSHSHCFVYKAGVEY